MYHMYQLDAFTQSCPADQDIINHYKLQQVRLQTTFNEMNSKVLEEVFQFQLWWLNNS